MCPGGDWKGETVQRRATVFRPKCWVNLDPSKDLMVHAKLPFHPLHASFHVLQVFPDDSRDPVMPRISLLSIFSWEGGRGEGGELGRDNTKEL